MSVELVVMIITAVSVLASLGGGFFAGFSWILRRLEEHSKKVDEQFAQVEASASERFGKLEERFARAEASASERFGKLEERFIRAEARANERFGQAETSVDKKFVQTAANVGARFDKVDERFDRMSQKFETTNERMNGVYAELTEIKVAVARLEGPRQRLIMPH